MDMEELVDKCCHNCGNAVEGNFCSHCGQRTNISPISIKELLISLVNSFNVEKGLLFTAKELSTRPGGAIRDYIGGKRIRYSNPIKYLLLLSAIAAFFNSFIPYEDILTIEVDGTKEEAKAFEANLMQSIGIVYRQYFTLIMVLSIPIISLLTHLFYYKHKVNFAKNMVLNAYLSAHGLIIFIILHIPVFIGFRDLLPVVTMLNVSFIALYTLVGYITFFKPRSLVLAIIKGLLIQFLYYIIVSISTGLIVLLLAYRDMI